MDTDAVLRALADPTRRLILQELAERGDQTLYELGVRLVMKHQVDMTRQGVAKHLALLEEAGLVRTRRTGRFKALSLDARPIAALKRDWLDGMAAHART